MTTTKGSHTGRKRRHISDTKQAVIKAVAEKKGGKK